MPEEHILFDVLTKETETPNEAVPPEWQEQFDKTEVFSQILNGTPRHIRSLNLDSIEDLLTFDVGIAQSVVLAINAGGVTLLKSDSVNDFITSLITKFERGSSTDTQSIQYDFSAHGLAVFCAAIDHMRVMMFASYLERQRLSTLAFIPEYLMQQIEEAAKGADYRWMSALFTVINGEAFTFSETAILEGCAELQQAGLLHESADATQTIFEPTLEFIALAKRLLDIQPGLAFTDADALKRLMFVGQENWLIHALERDKFRIGTVEFLDLFALLSEHLSDIDYKARSAPTEQPKPAEPRPQPPEDSFKIAVRSACPNCYHLNVAGEQNCKRCQKTLPPEPTEKSAETSCANCGEKMRTDVKFCTSCGHPR